jgi:signal transduction histidine kinase
LERVAAEQAALRRVATLVAEAVPPTEVFAAVAAEVARLSGVPMAGLFRFEPDGAATVIAAEGDMSAYLGRTLTFEPEGPTVLASLLRTGRPSRFGDHAEVEGTAAKTVVELGIGEVLGAPVVVDGRLWGAVMVGLVKGRPPLADDMFERLTAFTDLLATAISNAEARTAIAWLAEEQAALRRVATLVARGVQQGEIFAAVAQEVRRVLDVSGSIVRYEPDATATTVAIWGDVPLAPVGTNWRLEGDSVTARVFRTRRAARMDGYDEAAGELAAFARRLGARSVVGSPIVSDDRLWGVVISGLTSESVPAAVEARIANFTELLGIAISNAETRTELAASRARLVNAADDERRRIERDLHDGLQQRLVSLAMSVREVKTLTPRSSDEIQRELTLVADGLRAALEELREIARGIHPAVLSRGGLGPALKALARRSPVPIELHLDLASRLEEPLEVAAYYVASEAITNAAKHAQASVIEVRVDVHPDAATLTIRDDGVGGADPRRGSGIIGVVDRVEAVGGTVRIVSPPGGGTTLQVHLPRDGSAAPAPRAARSLPRPAAAGARASDG